MPQNEWPQLAESLAIAGQTGQAEQWRRDAAELALTRLRATDEPAIEGEAQASRWYWFSSDSSQRLHAIRSGLKVQVEHEPQSDDFAWVDEEFEWDEVAPSSTAITAVDELWEYALVDASIEQQFLACIERLGPGWGQSQTLQQAIRYLRGRNQPQQIIALLERVHGEDDVLHSPHLNEYVRSCFQSQSFDKLERVLRRAVEFSSTLENDTAVLRLMALRRQGKDDEAAALERQLLAAARSETPNPCRLDDRLVDRSPPRDNSRMQQRMQQRYMRSMRMGNMWYSNQYWRLMNMANRNTDLPTATALASAMGVRFEPNVRTEDLTIAHIRSAYQRHGLHEHAARLIALELDQTAAQRWQPERLGLLQQQVAALTQAGQHDQARTAATQAETLLLQQIKANPFDPFLYWELARLYQSQAMGPDYRRSAEALTAARELEPHFDPARLHLAKCLAKLGQHQEAWAIYNHAMQRGRSELLEQPTIFEAGIVASKVGQADAAQRLLRQATWRFPTHALAAKARELTHAR